MRDFEQNSNIVADVAAGAAANGTTYYYYDMRRFSRSSLQVVIAGAGTVTVTVEGASQNAVDATGAASLTYADLTNTAYGAANFTASGQGYDETGITGTCTWIRIKIVVASSDGTTAYSAYLNQTGW